MGIFKFFKQKEKAVEEVVKPQSAPVKEETAEEQPPEIVAAPKQKSSGTVIRIRYNRSFTAKLIQSDDTIKNYYGEIKSELSRYKVKSRLSWRYETFRKGRKLLARIALRGKSLYLYLALNPEAYAGTKYKINDVSKVAKNKEVPLLYKLKNDRRCKYAKDLITALMQENGLDAGEAQVCDYAAQYPYEELPALIERGLVKLLSFNDKSAEAEESEVSIEALQEVAATVESITVAEAEEKIDDTEAETYVIESEKYSDKTKKDIVNIDALSKYFQAGDNVTVEEIRKRVPSVHPKTTYIKVLARGTLDKPLNVEADDFSPAAIKMIVLTGGTVIRTRTRGQK